jgi:membrane protein
MQNPSSSLRIPKQSSAGKRLGKLALAVVLARIVLPPQFARQDRAHADTPKDGGFRSDVPAREHAASPQGEDAHGRKADSPAGIPPRGWWDIIWRVYEEIANDRVLAVAAGVTFYALLALFPAIGAFVSLYGLFFDPATINEHLASLNGLLPGGAIDMVGEQIKRISSKGGSTLGFALFTSLAISLWSANAGVKAVFDALNVAYGEKEKRSFVWLNLQSLLFTLGGLLFVLIMIAAVVVLPVALNYVGLGQVSELLLRWGRWPVMLLVVMGALAVVYRYGPSRDRPRWTWVSAGSLIAAFGWLVFSAAFSWYVANFGNYDATYGTLGAAIGFLTWVWLSTTIVLVGAEFNAEAEHQTKKDTTEGPQQPLGARGAEMADTVGHAR